VKEILSPVVILTEMVVMTLFRYAFNDFGTKYVDVWK